MHKRKHLPTFDFNRDIVFMCIAFPFDYISNIINIFILILSERTLKQEEEEEEDRMKH